MNAIDDFAALRPDVERPTPDELGALWDRATQERTPTRVAGGGRRRLAVVGAAASVVVGVLALVLVVGRGDAPMGDRTTSPAVTTDSAMRPLPSVPSPSPSASPTTASTTTLTSVLPPTTRLAIGDSVMLGAAEQLKDLDLVVDAVESRAFVNGLQLVRMLVEQDRLPETMVVHLGSNGPIGEENMAELIELVADVDTVVLVTLAIERDHMKTNNELLAATAAAHDNVSLLDWATLAAECSGDCFEADGFHLKPDGRSYYAAAIESVFDELGV